MAACWSTKPQAEVKPVLILDEAQNLSPAHLKLLPFLLTYETSREKLLQLVLFGQNELQQKIERFPELKSRMYPSALMVLIRADTAEMNAFRWLVAGGEQSPFSAPVLDEIFRAALGLPCEIAKLCDLASLGTFSAGRMTVENEGISVAATELQLRKD
ncbi:MAG: AAA family ATPase [Dehalococcoidia bacterium]